MNTLKADTNLLTSEIYKGLFKFVKNNMTQQEVLNVEEESGESGPESKLFNYL